MTVTPGLQDEHYGIPTSLHGQLGPVALFWESLSPQELIDIHTVGKLISIGGERKRTEKQRKEEGWRERVLKRPEYEARRGGPNKVWDGDGVEFCSHRSAAKIFAASRCEKKSTKILAILFQCRQGNCNCIRILHTTGQGT